MGTPRKTKTETTAPVTEEKPAEGQPEQAEQPEPAEPGLTVQAQERFQLVSFVHQFWARVYGDCVTRGMSAPSAVEHADRYVIDLLDHARSFSERKEL